MSSSFEMEAPRCFMLFQKCFVQASHSSNGQRHKLELQMQIQDYSQVLTIKLKFIIKY